MNVAIICKYTMHTLHYLFRLKLSIIYNIMFMSISTWNIILKSMQILKDYFSQSNTQ